MNSYTHVDAPSTIPTRAPQDTIDCSGSGDVDTATVVEALPPEEAGAGGGDDAVVIEGLSGRKLKLSPAWRNPTGKWHVGIKRAQELYPNGLKARVKAERKKEWTIEVGAPGWGWVGLGAGAGAGADEMWNFCWVAPSLFFLLTETRPSPTHTPNTRIHSNQQTTAPQG